MESFWNAPDKVDLIRFIAQWLAVISTIIALIFAMRFSTLKNRADAEKAKVDSKERTLLQTKIQTVEEVANRAKSAATEAKAKLQPRLLSEKQTQILHNALTTAHPGNTNPGKQSEVPIVVAAQMMNEESIGYAKQIHDAINNTGWEIDFTPMSTHVFPGIAIFYNPATKQSEVCKAVQNAFTKAGITFSTEHLDIKRIPIQADDTVYIVVGLTNK